MNPEFEMIHQKIRNNKLIKISYSDMIQTHLIQTIKMIIQKNKRTMNVRNQ